MTYMMDKVYENLYMKNDENGDPNDLDGGKQSVVLKRGAANANQNRQGGGFVSDCKCSK